MNNEHMNTVAARKSSIKGWEPYQWEVAGSDAVAITGGVPRLLTRGPRKGQKTWDGKGHTEIVTKAEAQAEFELYENETGNCGECLGKGEVFARWNHIEGVTYKECGRCNGSKAAP